MKPTDYWAKIKMDDNRKNIIGILDLIDHSIDVAACFEALLEHRYGKTLSAAARQNGFTKPQLSRLIVLALLHDLGKAHIGFQWNGFRNTDPSPYHLHGHQSETFALFLRKTKPNTSRIFQEYLSVSKMVNWFECEEDASGIKPEAATARMFLCAWHHHGLPPKYALNTFQADRSLDQVTFSQSSNRWRYVDFDRLMNQFRAVIFENWVEAYEETPPIIASADFMHEFNGILTLADWMASDDRYFIFDHGSDDRLSFARKTALKMLDDTGQFADPEDVSFSDVFGFNPRPIQQSICEI